MKTTTPILDTITLPMVVALRDLLDEPLQIAGPGRGDRWINLLTQRALLARGLVTQYVGPSLGEAVPSRVRAVDWPAWLVIAPTGRIVVAAFRLGSEQS
jgi:hypothetical protein